MGKISTLAATAFVTVGLCAGAMAQGMSTSPSTGSSQKPSATAPSSPSGASSLSGSGSSAMGQVSSESQVKSALEAKGYTNIKSIEKSTSGWTASADKNGKPVHVAVDDHGNVATR